MIFIQDVVASDEIPQARFACDLGRCKGACCVVGEGGAPIEEAEVPKLAAAFEIVRSHLRAEAVQVAETRGLVESDEMGGLMITTAPEGAECVFVVYDGDIAKCAIEQAYHRGETDWPKPISCHLFPIRVRTWFGEPVLNYVQIPECEPGRRRGEAENIKLRDFLAGPLTRRFGEQWYREFLAVCRLRPGKRPAAVSPAAARRYRPR